MKIIISFNILLAKKLIIENVKPPLYITGIVSIILLLSKIFKVPILFFFCKVINFF